MKLFRAMKQDVDGLPLVGRSTRSLGVRTPAEVTAGNGNPDVTAILPDEIIQPGTGGMSATLDDPIHLPPFRRTPALGGRSKDPIWVIDAADLGPNLQLRPDTLTHGLIEPSRPMTLIEFEIALAATRVRWQIHTV